VNREEALNRAAFERAQAIVGPYGDQSVSWSILLQAALYTPLPRDEVQARLADLAARHPHLGGPPVVEPVRSPDDVRGAFASTPYDGRAPLVRVALAASPPALLLAAHHGAADGLGLLALLSAATGVPVGSDAAGVSGRPAPRTFAGTAVRRVAEALFAPPTRLRPARGSAEAPRTRLRPAPGSADALLAPPTRLRPAPGGDGSADSAEILLATELPAARVGTATATAAALAVTRDWNRTARAPKAAPDGARGSARDMRIVAAIGASLRAGADPLPEHRAAYLRLALPHDAGPAEVRRLLDGHPPEPTFPPSRSRVAAAASRALAGRLGATFLVSNLGAVDAGEPIRSLSFFPQGTGRAGVAFGVVSTKSATSLTVRARAREFTEEAAAELLERFRAAVSATR
jgi:hypothetical protein